MDSINASAKVQSLDLKLQPKIVGAIEALGYRVTVGDVAAQTGLNLQQTESALQGLAIATGGHLQVSTTGEIAYQFSQQLRQRLTSQQWQVRLQALATTLWQILFAGIRVSFGLALVVSILLMAIAVLLMVLAMLVRLFGGDNDGDGGDWDFNFDGLGDLGGGWYWDWGWWGPSYETRRVKEGQRAREPRKLKFFEAVFSFLFGDGNPNADLDDRRWKLIAQVIRQQKGVVIAEQILPYLDEASSQNRGLDDLEDYMLPVLLRFDGQPQVSPTGDLVYQFPELQTTTRQHLAQPLSQPLTLVGESGVESREGEPQVVPYLREYPWRFSQATTGQLWLAGILGSVNMGLAIVLGLLLATFAGSATGFIGFVAGLYPALLLYGLGFLGIPLLRALVLAGRNRQVLDRNRQREALAQTLQANRKALSAKLTFAQQFGQEKRVDAANLAYSTKTDLVEQEFTNSDQVDTEWEQRLSQGQGG